MKQNRTRTAPKSRPAAPGVCRTPRLKKLPDFPLKEMALCPLPQDDPAALRRDFDAAPQFRRLNAEELLKRADRGLRIVLLGEDSFYTRQAAAYLTAMCGKREEPAGRDNEEFDLFDWSDEELAALVGEEDQPKADFSAGMAVISPALLDPDLEEDKGGPAAMAGGGNKKVLMLSSLRSPSMLIAAEDGRVLSAEVLEQLADALQQEEPPHAFIALKRRQLDRDMVEELCFQMNFRVCEVGTPDEPYLQAFLAAAAAERGLTLAPDLDAGAVLSGLRAYRGRRYRDQDIETLLTHVGERAAPGSILGTEDLLLRRADQGQGNGAKELEQMIGLTEVKETLRRTLALQILNTRRGRSEAAGCRNLAFCGSPGTGKSVTARLAADILRDAGCGTGRFVEAGREQLIGVYLGQTSPKIAKLFEEAAGGVLFIDEAGSLLGGEHDTYANEAVNALVRHMELHPETMVIFATYEPEMRQLLASNPGLSSRVAGIIPFPDYSDEELCSILALTAKKNGEVLSPEAAAGCAPFFAALRRRKKENFGNGREARRLFEAAREEMALRCSPDSPEPVEILPRDLEKAGRRLLVMEKGEETARKIGF